MKFKQPASRFALIGVFVAQTDSGVRVAVTGGGNGVFRHKGWRPRWARASRPRPRPP
jgi:carbon-monoxide dehydrogenase medium subunit